MTNGATSTNQPAGLGLIRVGLVALVILFGLCTIFVALVTAAQAWQEHSQERWPEVTAHVERCGLDRSSTGRRNRYYINCHLSYTVDAEQITAKIYSRYAPSPDTWQYPPNQIAPYQKWVDAHPPGTAIVVMCDPSRHTKAILATDYMPGGGPQTPNNVKLLEFCAGGFVALLAIARIARPRSLSAK